MTEDDLNVRFVKQFILDRCEIGYMFRTSKKRVWDEFVKHFPHDNRWDWPCPTIRIFAAAVQSLPKFNGISIVNGRGTNGTSVFINLRLLSAEELEEKKRAKEREERIADASKRELEAMSEAEFKEETELAEIFLDRR